MIYQPTTSARIIKQQVKSHLILVHHNFFSAQFHINIAYFALVSPTYVQFCTHIVVIKKKYIQRPMFLYLLKSRPTYR